jgi:hypothetical protein
MHCQIMMDEEHPFSSFVKRNFFYHFFRACAEEAIQKLHGTVIGQQSVRLSWGRSPANKQVLLIRNHLELQ